ncbi:hypothetical protein DFH28DRAFT_1181213 [Melampsora americana]|nr:hypothetical protein DFH28DRAFT_1181213 [Melampsora americana]
MHVFCVCHKLALVVGAGLAALGLKTAAHHKLKTALWGQFPGVCSTVAEEEQLDKPQADNGLVGLWPNLSKPSLRLLMFVEPVKGIRLQQLLRVHLVTLWSNTLEHTSSKLERAKTLVFHNTVPVEGALDVGGP